MADLSGEESLKGSFGQCLQFLLFTHGARPDGSPEKPSKAWGQKEFADVLELKDARAVRYWLKDEKTPSDLAAIERVLFGTNTKFDTWRKLLRAAYHVARNRLLGAPAPVDPQRQILHRDIRPVPGFAERADLLAEIETALWQKGGAAAITQTAAVKGLGGVGKTVLAREYAWRARGRYHGVWWVRAETEQTLIDDLIELGSRLIPNLREIVERERALHLTLDAIADASAEKPWLIVYDNVEKPGDVVSRTPRMGAHVLLTSRWPRWHGYAQDLPVDVFPKETAGRFLLVERPQETHEAADRLATALGFLPLALSHARAYCVLTNLGFGDYTRRLSELIREAPDDAEYPRSVHATFNLAGTCQRF